MRKVELKRKNGERKVEISPAAGSGIDEVRIEKREKKMKFME